MKQIKRWSLVVGLTVAALTTIAPSASAGVVAAFIHPGQIDSCSTGASGDLGPNENGSLFFRSVPGSGKLHVSIGLTGAQPNTDYAVDVFQCSTPADVAEPAGTIRTNSKGSTKNAEVVVSRIPGVPVYVRLASTVDDFWSDKRLPSP
jgi:hypothetical protein